MAERLNRSALVAHAADLSDEIGLDAVTITKVGRAVGIAAPGVYRHVNDIDDLRAAIGALASTEIAGVLATATAGRAGRDALVALATTVRWWAEDHPGRYAALQIAPDPDDSDGQAASDRLLTVIGAALRGYALGGNDFTDAVRLVRSAVHGFIDLERRGGFKQNRSVEVTFERIIDALDSVLRNWAR